MARAATTETHFYDGRLGARLRAEAPSVPWETPPSRELWALVERDFRAYLHPETRALDLMIADERGNVDAANRAHARRVLAELVLALNARPEAKRDLRPLVLENAVMIVTHGSCAQGRVTRLAQILLALLEARPSEPRGLTADG